jgi:hypothetical protein
MDLIAAWKASSIVLTGAFGILGLATDFKNERTKKITRWGYAALAGIVISTILGTAAQLKESTDNAAKALELAKESSRTLSDIERSLSQLNGLTMDLELIGDCKNEQFSGVCKAIRSFKGESISSRDGNWRNVFGSQSGLFEISVAIYNSPADLRSGASPAVKLYNIGPSGNSECHVRAAYAKEGDYLSVTGSACRAFLGLNRGSMLSMRDIPGKPALIEASIGKRLLNAPGLFLKNDRGESIGCFSSEKSWRQPGATACRFISNPFK